MPEKKKKKKKKKKAVKPKEKKAKKRVKALGLLSGGLDSALAVKLLQKQGIRVQGLTFTSPFCTCSKPGTCQPLLAAKELKIPLKIIAKDKDYLSLVRSPKYGYGSGVNPCLDCRIYILKKAKAYAKKIGADFIFTGEVLGQRPMSQHKRALELIEEAAGLKGKLLRPLSAKLLPETEAEKKGLVERKKLLGIQGRSRKKQLDLARFLELREFACPGGGCLLCEKAFAKKLNDLFQHKKKVSMKDALLLKFGRHFRSGKSKFIVGRNHEENERLKELKQLSDYIFEAREVKGPITLLQGLKSKRAVRLAAALTARYSDAETEKVLVGYGRTGLNKIIKVKKLSQKEIDSLRI